MVTNSNHPVHILNGEGRLSPSAFIPVCEFGGDMSAMGVNTDLFHFPVCNSFQATIFSSQLCYETDLNRFRNNDIIENQVKLGLVFIMDYNEDRQVNFNHEHTKVFKSLARNMVDTHDHQHAQIIINTIGNKILILYIVIYAIVKN